MIKLPISVFIIARNEADRIGNAIDSVKEWVEEVIVVDSGSTDETTSIATFHGATVIPHAWEGYGAQRRFAEEQCNNHWILALDADEEISPELADEIGVLFAIEEPNATAFALAVIDMLPDEETLSPFAHTNHVVRLYNFRHARYSDDPVHDSVIVEEGEVVTLKKPLLHRSFRSLSHAIEKMNRYSDVQAQKLLERGIALPELRLILAFPAGFIKCYLLRGYCLRGLSGFHFAVLYGFGRVMRIAKYMELKKIS